MTDCNANMDYNRIYQTNIKTYYAGISYLRILATVCIVWLHTCSTLYENSALFNLPETQIRFWSLGTQLFRWTVPVFFMITGALLIGKQISYRTILNKYVRRILLALFVFGIPFAALKLIMENDMSIEAAVDSFLVVFENGSFSHLWYLYVLIGLYLIFPILHSVAALPKVEFRGILVFLGLIDILIPTVNIITGRNIAFVVPLTYPAFYVLLGYYLHTYKPRILIRIPVILMCLFAIVFSNIINFYPNTLTSYDRPLTAILAMMIFSLFDNISGELSEMIWRVDRLCFGVYLIHPLFIHFSYRYLRLLPTESDSYQLIAVVFFFCFLVLSFVVSWLLSLIKPLKKYVL